MNTVKNLGHRIQWAIAPCIKLLPFIRLVSENFIIETWNIESILSTAIWAQNRKKQKLKA